MPDQFTARGSRAVTDLGGHRAGQLGHLGQRDRGQVPALPGQLDHPVTLGRAVPPRASRLPGSCRAAAVLPRLAREGAKFRGEPVTFTAQFSTGLFQRGHPRLGAVADLSGQVIGILADLRELGP